MHILKITIPLYLSDNSLRNIYSISYLHIFLCTFNCQIDFLTHNGITVGLREQADEASKTRFVFRFKDEIKTYKIKLTHSSKTWHSSNC